MNHGNASQLLLETPYFNVVNENGYYFIKEAHAINGVVVVPQLVDGRVMLGRLRRRAIGGTSIEFPRGAIDAGESACCAGARELLEETGWQALEIKELGVLHSNTSLIASSVAVCLASLSTKSAEETDGELDNIFFVTRQELMSLIATGQITDGHTLSAAMMMFAHEVNRL
ncbi:NUDIX hydrolase [Pseudomonas baetica]|uniref:NUDIX hydrolase n=1 Tax=Pseudomonas baetica TaxID=674054 RepID=UPI002406FACB|nr:NUDIX hydrolase [Pseudomonas baetica]MDF9779289.1 ADP-ribose pyrophosphatase [Pseudomonas baetica]